MLFEQAALDQVVQLALGNSKRRHRFTCAIEKLRYGLKLIRHTYSSLQGSEANVSSVSLKVLARESRIVTGAMMP